MVAGRRHCSTTSYITGKIKKYVVIVNDMSELNINEKVIEQGGFSRTDEKLVELSNGCIRCTLREDLLTVVYDLTNDRGLDGISIESSGISEPIPVAQRFTYADDVQEMKGLLKTINASARLLTSTYSELALDDLLDVQLFDFDQAMHAAGWIQELEEEEHTPETEEYGISSFVYRSALSA